MPGDSYIYAYLYFYIYMYLLIDEYVSTLLTVLYIIR